MSEPGLGAQTAANQMWSGFEAAMEALRPVVEGVNASLERAAQVLGTWAWSLNRKQRKELARHGIDLCFMPRPVIARPATLRRWETLNRARARSRRRR